MLWRFLALRYCVGHHFSALAITGSAVSQGAIRAPLHVLVVLLCLAYRAGSCSMLFKPPHPHPPLYLCSLIHYILRRFSTVLPVQCFFRGGWGRVFLVGVAGDWVASGGQLFQSPMFLGAQPQYVTKALTVEYNNNCITLLYM